MLTDLDETDRKLLSLLQNDGKLKIKDLATQLHLSNSPVFERIKRLENEGYVTGYMAKVSPKKLGFNLTSFCAVTLDRHHKGSINHFLDDINNLDEVLECYHIAGQFDYLLKICVRDMDEYQEFVSEKLSNIMSIGKVRSSFVMTEVKNTNVYKTL